MNSVIEAIMRQCTALPKPGTPVAELTNRDKLAIAYRAGVPCEFDISGHMMNFRSLVPFGIADRGDGGYIVAQLAKQARP